MALTAGASPPAPERKVMNRGEADPHSEEQRKPFQWDPDAPTSVALSARRVYHREQFAEAPDQEPIQDPEPDTQRRVNEFVMKLMSMASETIPQDVSLTSHLDQLNEHLTDPDTYGTLVRDQLEQNRRA